MAKLKDGNRNAACGIGDTKDLVQPRTKSFLLDSNVDSNEKLLEHVEKVKTLFQHLFVGINIRIGRTLFWAGLNYTCRKSEDNSINGNVSIFSSSSFPLFYLSRRSKCSKGCWQLEAVELAETDRSSSFFFAFVVV